MIAKPIADSLFLLLDKKIETHSQAISELNQFLEVNGVANTGITSIKDLVELAIAFTDKEEYLILNPDFYNSFIKEDKPIQVLVAEIEAYHKANPDRIMLTDKKFLYPKKVKAHATQLQPLISECKIFRLQTNFLTEGISIIYLVRALYTWNKIYVLKRKLYGQLLFNHYKDVQEIRDKIPPSIVKGKVTGFDKRPYLKDVEMNELIELINIIHKI